MAKRPLLESMKDVFKNVNKELQTKIDQLETGAELGKAPTRQEIEQFCYKTARVIRKLIEPEHSEERNILWSEFKGYAKKFIEFEHFSAGQFTSQCVKRNILEHEVCGTLKITLDYMKKRQTGEVAAPRQSLEVDAKKAKILQEAKKKRGGGQTKRGRRVPELRKMGITVLGNQR
eukprot:TRINITY_DN7265_c0_g2_i1.p1 TRINITY_DN7265_c0_g2~~TRINITY_DN7265_c0_g2_i1.p1  ORF type:complete len:198 (-),score=27.83 TRINITY_DN7265_c0_g2_i1:415-939(-)